MVRWGCLGLGLLWLVGCAAPPRSTVPPRSPEPRPTPVVRSTPPAASTPSTRDATSAPDSGRRDALVSTARSYLGTPYRYGGNTRDGLDCSGLVCQVYRKHGMDLPRTSFHQYRQGRPVDRSDLQPGDLVFFSGSGGGVQHVGIYVGENRFLHASTHHRQVRIDSLSQRYFREHYLGARDLLGRPAAR